MCSTIKLYTKANFSDVVLFTATKFIKNLYSLLWLKYKSNDFVIVLDEYAKKY